MEHKNKNDVLIAVVRSLENIILEFMKHRFPMQAND